MNWDFLEEARNEKKHTCIDWLDVETIEEGLRTAFEIEVRKRGKEAVYAKETAETMKHVSKWLSNPGQRPWLLLYGNIGTGKTMLLKALYRLVNSLVMPDVDERFFMRETAFRRGLTEDDFCCAVTFKDRPGRYGELYRELERAYTEHVAELERTHLSIVNPRITTATEIAKGHVSDLLSSGFLAVDDIGVEPIEVNDFGTKQTPIVDLIYSRYDKQLCTVFSSNCGMKEIKDKYGERIADRLSEMCVMIPFNGESFRKSNEK